MYIRYDSLNRHEPLIMTLCNPGSTYSESNQAPTKVVGILTDTSDEELCLNFNQVSELNFRVTKIHRDDAGDNAHVCELYKAIQARRLIFVTGIGYFMISGVDEGYDEDGTRHKDIKAMSVEAELQNHKVPYIEDGTYRFSTDNVNSVVGLLDRLLSVLPMWEIGTVDEAVASKYRTFEDVDVDLNILSFMLDNMQEAYECIFIFDPIYRIINVYDQSNYVHKTDIHITKEDLIRSIDISEGTEDLYTAMSVLGDENVSVAAINPLGGNTIYNFNNYLEWMSNSLKNKVIAWQNAVGSNEQSYYDTNLQYYVKLETASDLQEESKKIMTQLTIYHRCRENVVAELDHFPLLAGVGHSSLAQKCA